MTLTYFASNQNLDVGSTSKLESVAILGLVISLIYSLLFNRYGTCWRYDVWPFKEHYEFLATATEHPLDLL